MKKFIALALVVFAVASVLTGCSGNAKKIIGSWSCTTDLADTLKQSLGSNYAEMNISFPLTLVFDFGDDGSCSLTLDRAAAEKSANQFVTDMLAFVIADAAEDKAMTPSEFKAWYTEYTGGDIEEEFRQYFSESFDIDALAGNAEQRGEYKVSGDKLYTAGLGDDEYLVIEINGDTMRFVSMVGESLDTSLFKLPLELKRVG